MRFLLSLLALALACGAPASVLPDPVTGAEASPSDSRPIPNSTRAYLQTVPDPLPRGDIEVWWEYASKVLALFSGDCAFPESRSDIQKHLESVRTNREQLRAAHGMRDEVACPGEGLTENEYAEIDAVRERASEEIEAAQFDLEQAYLELGGAYGGWSLQCLQTVLPTDWAEMSDAQGDMMNAFAVIEDGLNRLADAPY